MSQHPIEIILLRQLAGYLSVPVFLVGADGTLIFYNEPAEPILGQRFAESGEMTAEKWMTIFDITDESGTLIPPEALPLARALFERVPAHRDLWLLGLDGERRHLTVTAIPLIGQADHLLGAVALFWEASSA